MHPHSQDFTMPFYHWLDAVSATTDFIFTW